MNENHPIGHLAALAADIGVLHTSIRRSAEQAARDTIGAGKLLIEAKRALPHGRWEAWLREHVTISPRTARSYMRIAASTQESGHAARGVTREQATIARIQQLMSDGWKHLVEAGRECSAVLDRMGEEQFRVWAASKTGLVADEALFLAELAKVADAGGDVAALLARDHGPKEIPLPTPTEAEAEAIRKQGALEEAEKTVLWKDA